MSIASKLSTISQNMNTLYNKAYTKGYAEGNADGNGAAWDAFWDTFQQKGERTAYNFGFINAGKCWDKTNFRPKYNITLKGNANSAFYSWQGLSESVDIGKVLKEQRITLDTSEATNLGNLFQYGSSIGGSLPTIDLTKAGSNTGNMFDGTRIVTIEKLVVTTTTNFTNMFRNCTNLENIVIEGTIASNNLDLSACKNLSGASLESVVRALSETATGLSVKFPNTAPDTFCDYLEQDSAWDDLIVQRDNWTFAYA